MLKLRTTLCLALIAAGAFVAQPVLAQTFTVAVDSDNDAATGCDIATPEGPFAGVERLVTTTVGAGGGGLEVQSVEQSDCVDPGTDTFGAPVALSSPFAPPWPVGVGLGVGGTDVVETYVPLTGLGASVLHLAVTAGDDALVTTTGTAAGGPILLPANALAIPTLSEWGAIVLVLFLGAGAVFILRRRRSSATAVLAILVVLTAAGVAWAAIQPDGMIGDWTGFGPLATDAPEGPPPPVPDLAALFCVVENDVLFCRVDALINSPPLAGDDSITVDEGGTQTLLDGGAASVLANDVDPQLDPLTVTLPPVTDVVNGTLALAADGTFSYTHDGSETTADSFVYEACDNGAPPLCDTATVTIVVNPVDDPPTAVDDTATVAEDDPPTAIDVLANDTDPDGGPISIDSTTQPPNGTVVITGGGTGLTYEPDPDYCNDPPGTTTDDFTYTLMPGGSTATVAMTVTCVNDAPVKTAGGGPTPVFTEGGAPVAVDPGVTVTDSDDANLESATVTITNLLDAGDEVLAATTGGTSITASYVAPTLTLTGSDTVANYQAVLQSVTYENTDDDPDGTDRSIDCTVNDGDDDSNTLSITVQVTPVNDAPVKTAGGGATPTFTEGGLPVAIDPGVTLSDPDDTNLESAMVTITNLLDAGDELLAATTGGTSITASYVAPTLTLTGSDTVANYQQVLRSVTYENTDTDPDGTDRSIDCTVNDGDADSNTLSITVQVVPVNSAPTKSGTVNAAGFVEDLGAVNVYSSVTVNDADDTNLESATITLTNRPDGMAESLSVNTGGTSIAASAYNPATGVISLAGTDTLANYQAVIASLQYNNTDQDADETPRTISCVVNDGDVDSNTVSVMLAVDEINDPPMVTSPIAYSAVGNTLLRVDGADADNHDTPLPGRIASTVDLVDALVKAAPIDPDSPSVAYVPGTFATALGGSVTLDDDGDFFYVPPTGMVGADSVVLTVTDGEGGNTPVTLQLNITDLVWYVEDTVDGSKNPAAGGPGTSLDAFETLAAAEAASGVNHYILVFETDAPLDEGLTLKNGQKLYGQRVEEEAIPLLPGGLLLEEIADTNARPVINRTTGAAVTVDANAASLANVEIRHLDLQGSTVAIDVLASGGFDAGVTIDENKVSGAGTGSGIRAVNAATAGTVTLAITDNVDITSSAGAGIELDGSAGGTMFLTDCGGNSVHGDTTGSGMFFDTVTFDADTGTAGIQQVNCGATAIGSGGNPVGGKGVDLDSITGDLRFTSLTIESVLDGLELDGLGLATSLTVDGGSVVAGGPAVDVNPNANLAAGGDEATINLTFATVTSTSSGTTGVSLRDAAGSFNAGVGSSISAPVGHAFNVESSLPNALNSTYSGNIANNAAALINVNGVAAGTLLFDGMSVSAMGGTGIQVADMDATLTVTAAATSISGTTNGLSVTGDTDGTVNLDDTTITNTTSTALRIDGGGGDLIGGTFDFDNVDINQGTNNQRMVDVRGMNGGSVHFDALSALSATDGTGIIVTSNGGTSPVTFLGPVDLGTGASRLSDGDAFTMSANSVGTTVAASDVDIFTNGRQGVVASGSGTLDLDQASIDTTGNGGRGVNLGGIVSAVDVDTITCSNNSDCVTLATLAAGSNTTFADVDLDCTGGTCFNASSARTVEATGAGNTVDAVNAIGLVMATSTIGTNGMTFQRISAGDAVDDGPAYGIRLNSVTNAGALGFTVTGTGADGSGGVIQFIQNRGIEVLSTNNVSFSDMNLTSAATTNGADPTNANSTCGSINVESAGTNTGCNAAVHLQTVSGATIDNFNVVGSTQQGINGNDVTNLVLTDSFIDNIGDQVRETGIRIRDLKGTSVIDNTIVEDSAESNVEIRAHAGTLNLDIRNGSVFRRATGNGLLFETSGIGTMGSPVVLTVRDSEVSNNDTDGVHAFAGLTAPASGGVMRLDLRNTVLQDNNIAVNAAVFGTAHAHVNIRNNGSAGTPVRVKNAASHLINITTDDAGTLDANVLNNYLDGRNDTPGNLIRVRSDGATNPAGTVIARLLIDGNTLVNPGTVDAMFINIRDGVGGGGPGTGTQEMHATVTNNTATFGAAAVFSQDGIETNAQDSHVMCVAMGDLAAADPPNDDNTVTGFPASEIEVRGIGSSTVNIFQGGSASAVANTVLTDNNIVGAGGVAATSGAATKNVIGTACTLPTAPPP